MFGMAHDGEGNVLLFDIIFGGLAAKKRRFQMTFFYMWVFIFIMTIVIHHNHP